MTDHENHIPTIVNNDLNKDESIKGIDSFLSTSSESKEFISNIKDKVLHKSESTTDNPPIDYTYEFNILMKAKDEANKISKVTIDIGLDGYFKINKDIESYVNILNYLPDKDKRETHLANFRELKKQIYSNIARVYAIKRMYNEAIKYDEFIIQRLDVNFIRSYGRQIHCHRKIGNYENANIIRKKMENLFNHEVLIEYKQNFIELDQELKKNESNFGVFSKKLIKNLNVQNTKKNESTSIDSQQREKIKNPNKKITKEKNLKKFNLYKWIFGALILIGSSSGLYFLIKKK